MLKGSRLPYSRGQWSTRLTFVMAAAGSAVGLGNIWKFPYTAGDNGGSSFILIYLICILLIGLPILCCEVLIGRHGKSNTVDAFKRFSQRYGLSGKWSIIGWMGIITGLLILSYYSVIAGWVMAYALKSITNTFQNMTPEAIGNIFGSFIADPTRLILWHTFFMVITVATLAGGVRHGIERVVKLFIPLLIVILVMLILYNVRFGNMSRAIDFMFSFEIEKINPEVVLIALGQAFFSLSLGMGAMMIYGSYLPNNRPLWGTTLAVVIADTSVALLAGLAIFPLLFVFNMEATQGVGLIFTTLPIAIGKMPGGMIFGFLFFFLLFIAAWTSALSLLEPLIAWCVEKYKWKRRHAAIGSGLLVWSLGLLTAFSFNHLEDFKFQGFNPFELLDYLTSNILLPLGGLLIVIFAGWFLPSAILQREIGLKSEFQQKLWRIIIRYFCPIAILLIFISLIT